MAALLTAAIPAGCASAGSDRTGSQPTKAGPGQSPGLLSLIPPTPTSTAPDSAATAPTAANRQAAGQAATTMLGAYVPPPRSQPATSGPAAMVGEPGDLSSDLSVEQTRWWVVDEDQADVQKLLRAEVENVLNAGVEKVLPDTTVYSSGSDGSGLWSYDEEVDFDSPNLGSVTMNAQVEPDPAASGKTMLRVDTVVTYLPGRTAAENIGDARSVTVTAYSSAVAVKGASGLGPVPGETVTVTDPAKVSALAALVDSQPTETDGPKSCPDATGGVDTGLWLDFHPAEATAPDILVDLDTAPCAGVSVTVGRQAQPALNGPQAGQVLRAAGVNWSLTSTSPADPAR